MYYFTTRAVASFSSYTLKEKYAKELDDSLSFLDRLGVERYLTLLPEAIWEDQVMIDMRCWLLSYLACL